jgi:hypothetical protein
MVERRKLRLAETLRHREDGTVNETDFKVGVCAHRLGGALVVRG